MTDHDQTNLGRNNSLNFSRPLQNSNSISGSMSSRDHNRNESIQHQYQSSISTLNRNESVQHHNQNHQSSNSISYSFQNQSQSQNQNHQVIAGEAKGKEKEREEGGAGTTNQFSSFWKRSVLDRLAGSSSSAAGGGGGGGVGAGAGKGREIVFLRPDGVGDYQNPGQANERPSAETKKSRREQVRKAQIEHRNRKKNYVAYLESDILELREKIDAVNLESNNIRTENDHMKNILGRTAQVTTSQSRRTLPTSKFSSAAAVVRRGEVETEELARSLEGLSGEIGSHGGNSVGGVTKVMMGFDEMLGANCLRTSYASSSSNSSASYSASESVVRRAGQVEIAVDTPTLFSFPGSAFGGSVGESMDYNIHGHQQNDSSHQNSGRSNVNEANLDPEIIAEIGINFILALEHPCLTHFHHTPHPSPPPTSGTEHTGHVLMASTSIYSHAPAYIFPNIAQQSKIPHPSTSTQNTVEPLYIPVNNCSWELGGPSTSTSPPPAPSPTQELLKLKALNDSLPKDDVEITPVQAWFLIVDYVGVGGLVGVNDMEGGGYSDGYGGADANINNAASGRGGINFEKLEVLKRELGKLVRCIHFGAVVEGWRFWEVLGKVVGADNGGGGGGYNEQAGMF